MAGIESIHDAKRPMQDCLEHLNLLFRALDECARDNPPYWLALLLPQFDDLRQKLDAYLRAVDANAIPVLRDMQRLSKA